MDQARDDFLFAEEEATARLVTFYRTARLEIEEFLERGNPTPADRKFYRAFLVKVNQILEVLEAGAQAWVTDTISGAYGEGAALGGLAAYQPVHVRALEALADYTMGLIRSTSQGVRRGISQAVASGILEGLTGQDLRDRIRASGLQAGPWSSIEQRAGVIARTETMRAFNAGNLAGVREAGGHAVKWIAALDERLCPVCAPRAGRVFYLDAEGAAMFPAASEFPGIPAHPRCRCTIRAAFGPEDSELVEPTPGGVIEQVRAKYGDDALAAARRVRERAVANEIRISDLLQSVSNRKVTYTQAMRGKAAAPGGDLAGFENRLKSLESTTRKVKGDALAKGMGLEQAADEIGDLVRYTVRADASEYTSVVARTVADLKASGYTQLKFKVSWDDPVYRGINSNWVTPDGMVFEVQFHTPQSFMTKELNHHDYEVQREIAGGREGDPGLWDALTSSMEARTGGLEQPPGWESLR